ncbi:MAG: hypothetical protein ACOC92_02085 [bacterium]
MSALESGRIRVVRDEGLGGMADGLLEELKQDTQSRMPAAQELGLQEIRRTLARARARPARPGEPPRRISGDLMRSWRAGRVRASNRSVRGELESDHDAAGALEWGAPRLGIEAHPYVRPTFARIQPQVERILMGGR